MTELSERLMQFERRLHWMETELSELRRLAAAGQATSLLDEPPSLLPRREPPQRPAASPVAPPPPSAPPPPRPALSEPEVPREPFDLSALLGARALAWTGGGVTLLGIVFFFVLAAERGWVGHGARVTLGAVASLLLVATGAWLRRKHGDTYASVSAAGAGLAGLYATLLAATALYDLIPSYAALGAAAAIAGLGAVVALAWTSETLASLGLVGAMLVPVPIAIQGDELSAVGTAFAALVLLAATVVAANRNWRGLLIASIVATAPQAIAIELNHHAFATELAIAFWLVYGAGATWLTLRTRLTYLNASLIAFSGLFGGWSAALLFSGRMQGGALLVVAAAYAGVSVLMYIRDRDTSSVMWAISLTVAAVGAASLTSGATLTIVWAAEAAALAWLARKLAEPRFQLAALGWLGLAFVHGIGIDAPPAKLFVENTDAWRAAPSALALAIGTTLVGLATFAWEERTEGVLAGVIQELRTGQRVLRVACFALGGAAALCACSLAVVELPSTWDRGHVAVAGLWTAVAVCLAFTRLRLTSLIVAAASVVLVLSYDLPQLAETERSWAFAIVAAGALAVSLRFELSSPRTFEVPSLAGAAVSAGLATAAAAELFDGRVLGSALVALAALYGVVGVAVLRRRRDFASALGVIALTLAVPATLLLVHDTWVVLSWSVAAAVLALLVRFEERLVYAAVTYFGLAFLHTIVLEAQPSDLFVAHRHPGSGAPAALLVLGAAATIAWSSSDLRRAFAWACGALGLYAATLAILEASETAGGGIDTAFQRGHTAVSALWGAVGLSLLVIGLKRRRRELQFGGFGLFGIALAKLFLYDLAFLSSIARAFSFIAVGGLLVAAGFFYQRLAVQSRA